MNDMIDQLTFKEKIKTLTDRELAEYNAESLFDMCSLCNSHTKKIAELEDHDHKTFGMAGGAGGGVTAVLGIVIIVVLRRLGVDV